MGQVLLYEVDSQTREVETDCLVEKIEMKANETSKNTFPRWLFAILAIGGLLASGVYIGIMSAEGFSILHFAQAAGFGLLGLLMFWGAIHQR